MQYISHYQSSVGGILLAADKAALIGLWFEGEKYFADNLDSEYEEKELPVFEQTKCWLDIYFSGREPDFMPPVHLSGSPFRLAVWHILRQIPYGRTITYGEIAEKIAKQRNLTRVSAQAVGSAIGHNPVSIIVPCHRVIARNGSLTGYAGGLKIKQALLTLERGK